METPILHDFCQTKETQCNEVADRILRMRNATRQTSAENDRKRKELVAREKELNELRRTIDYMKYIKACAPLGSVAVLEAQKEVNRVANRYGRRNGKSVFFREKKPEGAMRTQKVLSRLSETSVNYETARAYSVQSLFRPHSALDSVENLAASVHVLHNNISRSTTRPDSRERFTPQRLLELTGTHHENGKDVSRETPPSSEVDIEASCERLYRQDVERRAKALEALQARHYPEEDHVVLAADRKEDHLQHLLTDHAERKKEKIERVTGQIYPSAESKKLDPRGMNDFVTRLFDDAIVRKQRAKDKVVEASMNRWKNEEEKLVAHIRRSRGKNWVPKVKIGKDAIEAMTQRLSKTMKKNTEG